MQKITAIQKMVEWLEIETKKAREYCDNKIGAFLPQPFITCLEKARSLAAEEPAPPADSELADDLNELCNFHEKNEVEPEHIKHNKFWIGFIRAALSRYPVVKQEKLENMPDYLDYDAGLLNDYGGGKVEWWQDYIRHELERCNDHWKEFISLHQEESLADKRDLAMAAELMRVIKMSKIIRISQPSIREIEAILNRYGYSDCRGGK